MYILNDYNVTGNKCLDNFDWEPGLLQKAILSHVDTLKYDEELILEVLPSQQLSELICLTLFIWGFDNDCGLLECCLWTF